MLEGLAIAARLQLLRMADGAGFVQVLVPAAMIEVVVRVDDVVDVAGLQPELGELAGNGLRLILDRLLEGQHAHHMVEVVAGVEHVAAVLMLDQHGIAGKADLAARPAVPEGVVAVDDQRSPIEQIDFRVGHLRILPSPCCS